MKIIEHYINGQQTSMTSTRHADVCNPATGEVASQVALASKEDVHTAVESASKAFPAWSKTPPLQRANIMFRYRQLVLDNIDLIAETVSKEHGKTLGDARGSIARGVEVIEFCCAIASHLGGTHSKNVSATIDTYNIREPVGVVAGITPFNFPAMVPMWMFPVALACGNTFILKPSEKNPSCSMLLARLMSQAGLPSGCLNVLHGDKEAVDALLQHQDIAAISFVGSTRVGKYVYQQGCAAGKRVQVLCGAKNHMVIAPDADISQAVKATLGAAYGSAGERCMAVSVVVAVGDDVADAFIEQLTPMVKGITLGPYTQSSSVMGPVITRESQHKIEAYINQGVEDGAALLVDGRSPQIGQQHNGFFVGATLFDRVQPSMSIYTDEIFGPVLCVVRADSYEIAKQLVIDHEYGNGASIFTRNGALAQDFAESVNIGMVGINVPIPVPVALHSFGGWKNSLFGDHSIHGMEGVRFYTRLKTVTQKWAIGSTEEATFHFRAGKDVT